MIVFSRKIGEGVVLTLPDGRTVTVTFLCHRRGTAGRPSVRIGVQADRDVKVMRSELLPPTPPDAAGGEAR